MAFAAPRPQPSQPPSSGGALTDTPAADPRGTPPAGPRRKPPRQAYQQYQRAQIETASPTRLIVLLYDGAIRFCSLALEAQRQRDLEGQNVNLIKAQRILAELMSALDRKTGGEVAENLFQLYSHMLEQLVNANLYDRAEPIENVVKMLRDLRDTWQEVERLTTQTQGEEPPASEPGAQSSKAAGPEAATASTPRGAVPAAGAQAARALPKTQAPPTAPRAANRLGDRHA
ncbi:MAG TPA: flagellar export chaperone FliS [Chthonomonadaceae bacterium]|nr:flagellar export chaperone FliS [Chthonomonadaceae bacterium]